MADEYSRFIKTPTLKYRGELTYGSWVRPDFLVNNIPDDQIGMLIIDAALEGRPSYISHQLYGTPLLDWVLISFNNAIDVLNWPRAGDIIKYPLDSIIIPQLLG